jgi:hypothetical protein
VVGVRGGGVERWSDGGGPDDRGYVEESGEDLKTGEAMATKEKSVGVEGG